MVVSMFKFVFFVPPSHFLDVKSAIFSAGGGVVGNYQNCCWYILGRAEFVPLEGSTPSIGKAGEVSQVEEYRVEVLLDPKVVEGCIAALKLAHPYETPVYELIKLEMCAL
jgi:hypothetical protein